MIKFDTYNHQFLQLFFLGISLLLTGCGEQSSLSMFDLYFGCDPTITHSRVKESWDNGDPKVKVEYINDVAVRILEFYPGGRSKLEIHECSGEYGGSWGIRQKIPSDIAQLELEIETLEYQYKLTNNVAILADLNELKKDAIFDLETEVRWRERRKQYAREIYDYNKSIKDEKTVTRLREVMYPMGYYRDDGFVGDEAYLTYPYDSLQLSRQQVVVQYSTPGQISKVYWYDEEGSLRRIHMPQIQATLFIEEYGLDGSYAHMNGTSTTAIYGGTFDDFNVMYRGGSGWSDIGVEYGYLTRVVETTENSVNHLEEIIKKYEAQSGMNLTQAQFLQPANSEHPLMLVNEMNLAYLFDGHGKRLEFSRKSPAEFYISSVSLEADQKVLEKFNQDVVEFHEDMDARFQRLIITCTIILLVIIASIVGVVVVRKKSKHSLSED
ncbi:MAG: hypothetical protein GY797_25560 [Deltaproteobacteria bacterium]|nr:hypothetical protein [Deltaproteobacteria bacterium]